LRCLLVSLQGYLQQSYNTIILEVRAADEGKQGISDKTGPELRFAGIANKSLDRGLWV